MSRVLLVEPYFSGSHQTWAEGYVKHSRHEVDLLTLPGRFWKWRMFGGSLSLARQSASFLQAPDVLLTSDMLDLAAFMGHAGPALGSVKTVLYMHENQLTYPLSPTARDDLAYAYMNWSSMVRADDIWFNSQFHLDAVFDALPKFLRHFPDHRHVAMLDETLAKSRVVPVGVDLGFVVEIEKSHPPLIIWNQRWEHDKNPVRMWAALRRLAEAGVDFRVAICGENFSNTPEGFSEGRTALADMITHYGYASRPRYEELLNQASVVLSTAEHEFFGIAVVEAMAAGALPVLPAGLSYPGLVPGEFHAETLFVTESELTELLRLAVEDGSRRRKIAEAVARSMRQFDWSDVAPLYDDRISQLSS